MAYTPPPRTEFAAIFPAFASVTDEQYAFWSAQAALITDPMEGCLGARMDLATMLVTAHYLTLAGIGSGTEAQMAAQGATGFTRIKSGTLELERGATAQSDSSMGEWGGTSFGKQVWPMLKACTAGPRVTGTGRLMGGCGFNGFAGPLPNGRC